MFLKKISIVLFLLICIIITLLGCGSSGSSGPIGPTDNPKPAVFWSSTYGNQLGWGEEITVSQFNSVNKYTMIVAPPCTKPEGNSGLPKTYSFTIATTTADSSYHAPADLSMNNSNVVSNQLYGSKKTSFDLIVREKENAMLASGNRELSKKNSSYFNSSISSATVGTRWDNVYIAYTEKYINTICEYVSEHAYFFVDDRDIIEMNSYLSDYAIEFEKIYTSNHNHFGTENDTDSNGKIIIIFSRELSGGLLGYFYAVDKFYKTTYKDSNEGDIIYITTDSKYQGDTVEGTLAHEFQHMIYFDQHYNRGVTNTYTWLNEALSQAAEYFSGHTTNHLEWINAFLSIHTFSSDPSIKWAGWEGLSLTYWTPANYGYGAIFIRYLIDQYGDTTIYNMCSTDKVGISAVESATGVDFNILFVNFSRAVVLSGLSDPGIDPLYKFKTLDIRSIQADGRAGLETRFQFDAGDIVGGNGIFPYMFVFIRWQGNFTNAKLSGNFMEGTFFGISH